MASLVKAGMTLSAAVPAQCRRQPVSAPSSSCSTSTTGIGSLRSLRCAAPSGDACCCLRQRRGNNVAGAVCPPLKTPFRGGEVDDSWVRRAARDLTCRGKSQTFLGGLNVRAISSNDFRVGVNIELDNAPWRVMEFLHVKPGKGAAFVRTKLRNYITGNTVERTFRAGESVDEASVQKDVKQHTYVEGDVLVFMDMGTYEETRIRRADIGPKARWLSEGMECSVLTWNDKVIDIDLPITVQVKIADTEPGIKGDTASGGTKPATLENGATVNVPFFVNIGDEILVDTRTSTYMSRA
ncbi:hypothetical protein CBR_g46434 [Chara braunii]|uniref:Elongation factor P n=1 Tax=Chara braunii TaxID=69332 RepID=A0A388M0M8_CHABU|nr:hypothetical protein CBR_g46434 [Chara braunii]|eukprot:GBG88065.1 hypothetical protein CBR_g46434 [Chara braunii]